MPCFFINAPATTAIYTLSLHDALPIYSRTRVGFVAQLGERLVQRDESFFTEPGGLRCGDPVPPHWHDLVERQQLHHLVRSEEHTSELQSQSNLVCRLLLEKKKQTELHW